MRRKTLFKAFEVALLKLAMAEEESILDGAIVNPYDLLTTEVGKYEE